jgi:hypothetical protein
VDVKDLAKLLLVYLLCRSVITICRYLRLERCRFYLSARGREVVVFIIGIETDVFWCWPLSRNLLRWRSEEGACGGKT